MINKRDLAPHVGADLEVMRRDAVANRGELPLLFANMRDPEDRRALAGWVLEQLSAWRAGRAI